MNPDELLPTLKEALTRGVTASKLPPAFEYLTKHLVNAPPEAVAAVENALKNNAEVAPMLGKMLMLGSFSQTLDARTLAEWLIAQAFHEGPEATAEQMAEYVNADGVDVEFWGTLQGVSVETAISLGPGLTLLPASAAPELPTNSREHLPPPFGGPQPKRFFSAAIRKSVRVRSKVYENEAYPSELHAAQGELGLASMALAVCGPSSPLLGLTWSRVVSWVPMRGMGSASGESIHEIDSRSVTPLSAEQIDGIVRRFLELPEAFRKKLFLSLDRLNRALRRVSAVDTAIEVGIALEALLAADRNPWDPISLTLRLRGAWLGAASADERKRRYRVLNKAYSLRSSAVHGATINEQEARADLTAACELCAQLLRDVITRGAFPAWDDLILAID